MFAGEKRVTDSRVISRDYAIEITWIQDGGRILGHASCLFDKGDESS